MNTDFYRNYIKVIEEGGLSAASQKILASESVLSHQLKTLEREYGTALMKRIGRKLEPTDAGMILYWKAKEICEKEDVAQRQIQAFLIGTSGTLKIGITHIFPDPIISNLLGNFAKEFPNVQFELHEHRSDILVEMLKSNKIDAAIISESHSLDKSMDFSLVISVQTTAVFPKNNPWLSPNMQEIPITLLNGVPLAYPHGIQKRLTAACEHAGFLPNTFALCTTRSTAQIWAHEGCAIAIFACAAMKDAVNDDMCYRPIKGYDLAFKRVLVTMRDQKPSPIADSFIRFAAQRFR